MTFYISTFGCKVNQYESEFISELLLGLGYSKAKNLIDADINIVNTCTVTSVADAKNRKIINKIKRENPSSVIVLCGCMPQTIDYDSDSIYDKCNLIIGNNKLYRLPEILEKFFEDHINTVSVINHINNETFDKMSLSSFSERTRAFVKIEDGCNQFCTYCTIPYARGRVRSKPLSDIVDEVKNLVSNSYNEIVLVGINLSCYGKDENHNIYDVVNEMSKIDGIERIRLGSIEPERLTRDILFKLSEIKEFCPQFHLSLQSGCDNTLKHMKRHYLTNEYREIVDNIRSCFDNPSITTDVMVGFSGETDEDFNDSLEFVKEIKFAKIHIFPYSRRKGTIAYNFDNIVSDEIKKVRCNKMNEVAQKSREEFLNSQIGTIASVLFERKTDSLTNSGYSKNYTPVIVQSKEDLTGKILNVNITGFEDDFCIGELC